MKKLKVKIVTPQGVITSDDYISATVPSATGQLTVLAGHLPLVTQIKTGEIILRTAEGNNTFLFVSSGILEVRRGSCLVILADDAQRVESIDIEAAEAAKRRVEELLQEKKQRQEVDYAKLQAMLEKEMARVKIARKYRKLK